MRREIGGYFEMAEAECMLHPQALKLNSGRNCLAYLIESRGVSHIWLPDYLCDSVYEVCRQGGVSISVYRIGRDFLPNWDTVQISQGEYLYLVDYFGQLREEDIRTAAKAAEGRLIVDEVQALFARPLAGVDTLYSPRKFVGVADGGLLYTESDIERVLPVDESRSRLDHLFGRLERLASEFYQGRNLIEESLKSEPIKRMSRSTRSLLAALDLNEIKRRREANYRALEGRLEEVNRLSLDAPLAPFAYPLLVEDGPAARRFLAERGIYVPTLWPNVIESAPEASVAFEYAQNILPLPCDQRYGFGDMERIVDSLRDLGVLPRPLAGKRLAILGGTRFGCEIVECAKGLGVQTVVIDYNAPEDSPAKLIADEHALISVADTEAVSRYLNEHQVDGVLTGYSDTLLPMYADICEMTGLPCYGTRELFDVFTDKKKWKALCREYSIPTAREYDERLLCEEDATVPLPLFVKPSDGAGARGTSVVRTREGLQEAIEFARGFSRSGEVVIEDYLDGPEVTVFWLFLDGKYRVFMVGNRLVKHNQEGVIPLPAGYTFPSTTIDRFLADVAPRFEKLFADQGVRNGMMFMQCSVCDGLPFVYDIGYRLTGTLEHHITKARFGYSPMEMLVSHAITGRMTDDPVVLEKIAAGLKEPCYNISVLISPGTIGSFEGLEVLDSDESVIHYSKNHGEGDTLPPEAKGQLRQIALRVLGAVASASDLRETMLGLQSALRVISQQGEDLTLSGLEPSDFKGNLIFSSVDWRGGVRDE